MTTMIKRHPRPELPETQKFRSSRHTPGVEWELRESSGVGMPTIEVEGYAAVFDYEYEMYSGPPYGWIERIRPGAFDETLAEKPDVTFLINHEGLPLARTRSETLKLTVDGHGLLMRAELSLDDPDVMALVPKMRRKDVTEMSFAFRATEQLWRQHDDFDEDPDYPPARDITKVNINRGDVSVVTFGASDATEIDFRAALAEFGQVVTEDPERALIEMRAAGLDLDVLRSVVEVARRDVGGDQVVRRDAGREEDQSRNGMSLAFALSQLD